MHGHKESYKYTNMLVMGKEERKEKKIDYMHDDHIYLRWRTNKSIESGC